MLLREEDWLTLKEPIILPTATGHKAKCDQIDPRTENMRSAGYEVPKKHWVARLPDGRWLYYYDSTHKILEEPPQGVVQLPNNWYEYALGLYDGKYAKAALDWKDRYEPSQEQIDKQLGLSEQLDRVLFL